jgi:hypothetical protein
VTLGDGVFRKFSMKVIYRKFPKTASLSVTCHPQSSPEAKNSEQRKSKLSEVYGQVSGDSHLSRGLFLPTDEISLHRRNL